MYIFLLPPSSFRHCLSSPETQPYQLIASSTLVSFFFSCFFFFFFFFFFLSPPISKSKIYHEPWVISLAVWLPVIPEQPVTITATSNSRLTPVHLDTMAQRLIPFGPNSNCNLDLCPIEMSVYRYRPSLPANIVFLVLFAAAAAVHTYVGIRWKSWWFMTFMLLGCLVEMIGYVGRIMMYYNPFTFAAFMLQIGKSVFDAEFQVAEGGDQTANTLPQVFVTSGPVFYTAAIYVTLSKA
jgi:hypothetical protein